MSIAEPAAVSAAIDPAALAGDWRNTNAAGRIARIVCTPAGDGMLRVECSTSTESWGAVDAPTFSFTFDDKKAGAFAAVFPLPSVSVHVQANVKSGVLVVATFNEFRDDSGRSSYFDREVFYRI